MTFTSDDRGLATSPPLATGNVQLHVEFPGFEPYEGQLTLRRGAMNQTVTLKIAGFQEEVVVNDTAATDDRRGNSFTTTLEQSEIDELPDDPEELADVLTADGRWRQAPCSRSTASAAGDCRRATRSARFASAPTRSRPTTTTPAARRSRSSRSPNVVEWNGNGSLNYRGDPMNARNAFATTKTPEQNRSSTSGLRGPLVKGKTSIRFERRRPPRLSRPTRSSRSTRTATAWATYVRRPSESTNVTVGIEHALTKDQTLRVEYRRGDNSTDNRASAASICPERAYRPQWIESIRFARKCRASLGKTTLNELRLQYHPAEQSGGVAVERTRRDRARCVQRGGAGVCEQFVLARVRAGRQPRLQRRPQASDASRLFCSRASSSATSTRRTTRARSPSAISRPSTPAGPRRSRSASAR